jgi:PAS domain S-box-containing protein
MSIPVRQNKECFDHYEAVFEEAAMGILVVNGNGEITAINPFAVEEFGYTAKELMGKKIEKLIPQRFHKKHIHHRNNYLQQSAGRILGEGKCLFAIRKDGSEFPVEVSLGRYHNGGENYVIAFVSNITARKKSEAEIEKLQDELEATVEQRTKDLKKTLYQLEISKDTVEDVLAYQKAILDNAGAIIIATDEKGIIKLFNPEAANNLGYNEYEITNKKTPLLFHDTSEIERKRDILYNEFGVIVHNDFDVLVEKAKRNIHEEEQYNYKRKDGTVFPVLLTISAIRNSSEEITGFMGIAIDNSEIINAEESLREALKKEIELNELKSRFVSMASHEFRTPLSTVLSSAYLIEKYATTEDQPKREKHLQRIISSINMLTDILNDFLSLGKIEEGKIHVRPSEFNICELISGTLDEIKSSLKKDQFINYQHRGEPIVSLDLSLLKHIVMNLVSNASKFSPEKSSIEIKSTYYDHSISLSVKDHGIGISKQDQKHLMERFFRGANAGSIQGTGLGLHIVSKYAELMDGTVDCKSELDKGTEFIITFTLKKKGHEKDIADRRQRRHQE